MSLRVLISAQILRGLVTSVATSTPVRSSAFIHVASVIVEVRVGEQGCLSCVNFLVALLVEL